VRKTGLTDSADASHMLQSVQSVGNLGLHRFLQERRPEDGRQ
jgi:hypothetical protein